MGSLIDVGGIFDSLFGLAGELIEDKDKRNEFNMKIMESKNALSMAILQQKTHPKVDAAVKVMYALNMFWRPVVSAAMTIFGAYCHYKQIDLGSLAIHGMFDGAFPAWGFSRHVEKNKKS